jgi:hypothetical protein
MFSNIENNGAPWAFSPSDRFNWADDLFAAEKSVASSVSPAVSPVKNKFGEA